MGVRPPKPSTGLGVDRPPKKIKKQKTPGVLGVDPQKPPGRLGVSAGEESLSWRRTLRGREESLSAVERITLIDWEGFFLVAESIHFHRRRGILPGRWECTLSPAKWDSSWLLRVYTLNFREGFLLAAESVHSHRPRGIPLSRWECSTRDSSRPVRVYTLINQEEFLLDGESVDYHWPRGIPPGRWECTLSAARRNPSLPMKVYTLSD
jgi:hypothetical protein